MPRSTCDLCDDFPDEVQVADPLFRDFGARAQFGGRIVTIKCHEDNSRVRELVAEDGRGAVLCLSRGSGERRLRPLGSEEAEETTVPTSCALSFFTVSLSIRTVSLSLLSLLLYSFSLEFSLCSTIWFFSVFVGGVVLCVRRGGSGLVVILGGKRLVRL